MVCGLLGILTACTLLSSSCQRLLSYTVAYCPTVIATVNDSLADGYWGELQGDAGRPCGVVARTAAPAASVDICDDTTASRWVAGMMGGLVDSRVPGQVAQRPRGTAAGGGPRVS